METFLVALKAAVLGIVQGITEFLPISSSGHLIIIGELVKLSENKAFMSAFDAIIHLGSILAVIIVFWKKIFPFGQDSEHFKKTMNMWLMVLVGVIPIVIVGLSVEKKLSGHLRDPLIVAAALIFYGIIMIVIEKCRKSEVKISDVSMLPIKFALIIGIAQCLALVPGTSRSGVTIISGLLLGLSRVAAMEFSFFMAIPAITGAAMLKIVKLLRGGTELGSAEILALVVGFAVTFAVSFAVIKVFMNYISKKSFAPFGYYRIGLGLVIIALSIFGFQFSDAMD